MRIGVLFTVVLSLLAWSDQGHHHKLAEQELGSVRFLTSCARGTASEFSRGVALLHSFQYEQARAVFMAVANQDPACAMADWGVAMSHYHGLWDNGDLIAGRAALLRAQQKASSNPNTTAREKGYIDALGEIYRQDEQDGAAHARALERKMGDLQAAHPDDEEAAIFHALTLYITAPKTDRTFSNQRKCGEILEPLFQKRPHHPGIAHYLIHCYDNPALAEKGLPAARAYARIAPASAHAQHMPTHIFTRVGAWDDAIANNAKSTAQAAQDEATSREGEARDQRLHAMDYLEYAYLQSGRVAKARAVVDEMNALSPVAGLTLTGNYATAAIPARYAVELGDWQAASNLRVNAAGVPWAQAITWMAIGVGSARCGNLEQARAAEKALAGLRDATAAQNNTYWSQQVEVQRRETAAWIAQQSGTPAEAVRQMRSAAELEESMDKHAVTPGAITPAREMLAQILLEQKRPQLALVEYESVLKLAPNRFNALYGAASSAEASGDAAAAAEYFRKLAMVGAGGERPELQAARKKLAAKLP